MKKIIILFVLLIFNLGLGQVQVKKSSLAPAGGSVSAAGNNIVYTVGEVFVQENTVNAQHISEGFIDPSIIHVSGIDNYSKLTGIEVYPNPVNSYLNVQFDVALSYDLYLFDMNGRQLQQYQTGDEVKLQKLDFSKLPAGVYALVIIDRVHRQKKIVKIQKL